MNLPPLELMKWDPGRHPPTDGRAPSVGSGCLRARSWLSAFAYQPEGIPRDLKWLWSFSEGGTLGNAVALEKFGNSFWIQQSSPSSVVQFDAVGKVLKSLAGYGLVGVGASGPVFWRRTTGDARQVAVLDGAGKVRSLGSLPSGMAPFSVCGAGLLSHRLLESGTRHRYELYASLPFKFKGAGGAGVTPEKGKKFKRLP